MFGLTLAATAGVQTAQAAPLSAHVLRGSENFQLAGCGLGVRRGPDDDCTPVRPWRGARSAYFHGYNDGYVWHGARSAYFHGYNDGYVDGYHQGVASTALPYAGYVRTYPLYLPSIRSCGLNYSYSCSFGVCAARCW
jgi:hypothetical protein